MRDYFYKLLEHLRTFPQYAHTDYLFKIRDEKEFEKGWKKGFFSIEDLVNFADSYYYNFGGRVAFVEKHGEPCVKITVYTD